MNLGFLITGRMKSTRLPRKLTLKILDKEVITWMIMRAKLVFANEEIVIATSNNPQDDILEEISRNENVGIYRGHEEDVVLRLYEAAIENKFDYIINITADCPLFGFDYIGDIRKIIKNTQADLITSLDLPHGIFVYAIRTEAFKRVIEMKTTETTEVWGEYFYNNPDKFKIEKLVVDKSLERPSFRLTLDYPEDFEFFTKVYEYFGTGTYRTSSEDIVRYLDEHPEIVNINVNCTQKYQERWESQVATKLEKK